MRNVAANAGLASPHINDIVIRIRYRNAANRRRALLVKNRSPGHGAVGRLPSSAARRAEIIGRWIARNSRRRQRPPAAEGPDQTVVHPLERFFFRLGRFGGLRVTLARGRGWSGLRRLLRLGRLRFLVRFGLCECGTREEN